MLGMNFEQGLLLKNGSFGGPPFSRSFTIDLGLTNAICQITAADFGLLEGDNHSGAQISFIEVVTLGADGHSVHEPLGGGAFPLFNEVHTFARNRALSATYLVTVSGAYVSWVVNSFFWDSVS